MNIKSEIGFIVSILFKDKYLKNFNNELNANDRMKLQKQLSILINTTDLSEIKLSGNCYNQDGTVSEIPPVYEQEYSLT